MTSETNGYVNAGAIAYFNKVVLEYSKGDVEELLASSKRAGPLLHVTANGIDLVGGMCYGFGKRSSVKRSTKFMTEHMRIESSLAKVLYKCVRCGIVHQGVPKIGFKYFVPSQRLPDHQIILKGPDDWLLLNVQEFAYCYINAIKRIAQDPKSHIRHTPLVKDRDEEFTLFKSALAKVPEIYMDLSPTLGLASYSAQTPDLSASYFEVAPEPTGKQSGYWH